MFFQTDFWWLDVTEGSETPEVLVEEQEKPNVVRVGLDCACTTFFLF